MELATLAVLQELIDMLVEKNYLSKSDKTRIYQNSIDSLKETKPENPNQQRLLLESIRYLEHLISDFAKP